MSNFEESLGRLEALTQDIKRGDITLEEALKDFEEGIKLARGMEKELDAMESRIQTLMNGPETDAEEPQKKTHRKAEPRNAPALELFDGSTEINGTRNA